LKKYLWGICYGIFLTAFTVYVMLDTFVIARVYSNTPQNTEGTSAIVVQEKDTDSQSQTSPSHVVSNENSYSDENISITIQEYRENNTTIYVADVQLSSAEYLKTALAKGKYGKNVTEKTSEIAEDNNAILAINGDYYGSQERGYVLRNGVLYRNISDRNQ